jgi:chromosome partitioning protein
MRIIAVFSPLGGVGKTTIAVNLAGSLAECGNRVLLVDMDAQACATMALGLAVDTGASLYSLMTNGASLKEVVISTRFPNLSVIRSHYEIADVENLPFPHPPQLRAIMAELRMHPDFDCILLDCPPSMGIMTSAALAAADELLVPVQPGSMMLPTVSHLLGQMQQVIESGVNPGLHVGGFVINRFNGDSDQLSEIVHELHVLAQPYVSGNVAYSTAIPESIALTEAPCFGQTILEYDSNGLVTSAFSDLAREFVDRQKSKPT